MAQIEVTRDLLVDDTVFILQCLRQNERGGRQNALADVRLTLADSVTLDLADYVGFLRAFRYVEVDSKAAALLLTARGEKAALGKKDVATEVARHFAQLISRGAAEVQDVEGPAAIDALLRSAGLDPAPAAALAPVATAAPAAAASAPAAAAPAAAAPVVTAAPVAAAPAAAAPVATAAPAVAAPAIAAAAPAPSLPPPPPADADLLVVAVPKLAVTSDELGQGALGRVRQGRMGELALPVAVKEIKPLHEVLPWLTRDELVRRVRAEALAQARLGHPCILPVLDARDLQVVLPLAASNLRARLAGPRLALRDALRLAAQIAHALAHAHAAQVTHGALKPENVLLDSRGNALVSDFGAARLVALPQGSLRVVVDLGDIAYRPPEASASAPCEPAQDSFALGAVLYELLTGKAPGREALVPSSSRPECPRELDDLLSALLDDSARCRPSLQQAAERLTALAGPSAFVL